MSEMSQVEDLRIEGEHEAREPQEASGLGAIFRGEREKRGLSYEQVSQITRLRIHFLEALENEAWHYLPQSVFVRGFIKSYARALGLDESPLLDLYKGAVPEESKPPVPVIEARKTKKGLLFFILLLLGAIVLSLYLWMAKTTSEHTPAQVKQRPPTEGLGGPAQEAQVPLKKGVPQESLQKEAANSEPPKHDASLAKRDVPMPPSEEKEIPKLPVNEENHKASSAEPAVITENLVLTGIVQSRTWIKIYIDDQDPKEYILQPGSRPQWKAREGFFIFVGNAAGIDFDFNGKKIGDLGRQGQVVSLRLPKEFTRKISKD